MGKETIEIDLSLEDYFTINEMAREKEITLDEMVEDILREYMAAHPLPSKGVAMILRQSDAAFMVSELSEQLAEHNIQFAIVKDDVFDAMVGSKES